MTGILLASVVVITGLATATGYRFDIGVSENRTLKALAPATPQNLLSRQWFQEVNGWASDHQALRAPMIALHSAAKLFGFGAPLNDKTLVGRDGFYFYGMTSMRRDFEGIDRFGSDVEYTREVLSFLRGLEAWSKETGTRVLFMVAPNKHTVYSDKFDARFLHGPSLATAERIEAWLERYAPAMAVPIVGPLREAARSQLVYYRTDTHWNGWGARTAANVIAERLATHTPTVRLAPITEAIVPQPEVMDRGNFADLLSLPLREAVSRPEPKGGFRAADNPDVLADLQRRFILGRPRLFQVKTRSDAPQTARMLMLGDSFMTMLVPHLGERFSTSVYYNAYGRPNTPKERLPQDLIAEIKPDVLIYQLVERRLRPCRARSERAKRCMATLIGALPGNIQEVRLKGLAASGRLLASGLTARGTGDTWVLDLPEPLPASRRVLLRVYNPSGAEGRLEVARKRTPREFRGEVHRVDLDARRREGLMLAVTSRKRNAILLTPTGSLPQKQLRFDVLAVPDDTDPQGVIDLLAAPRAVTMRTQ